MFTIDILSNRLVMEDIAKKDKKLAKQVQSQW